MSATRTPQSGRHAPRTNTEIVSQDGQTHSADTVIARVDGSYHPDDGASSAGFVLEGNCGTTFEERWQECPHATTSTETEAAAALTAIRAAKKYEPSFIVLYSDCQPVVQRIDADGAANDEKFVYRQITAELDEIEYVSINYIPRERNQRADELAHRGLREIQYEQPEPAN
jgi:ribonuclease HI